MKKFLDPNSELDRALLLFRGVFFQVGAFSFVLNILMLVPAIYMMQVYDRVLSSRNDMTLAMLTVLALALFCLMGVLEWVRARVLVRVGTKLDLMLHERAFNAAFMRNLQRMGGSPAQAMNDITTIRQFLTGTGIFSFFDAPWVPIFIAITAMIHPMLGLFSLFAAVMMFVLALLNEYLTRPPLDAASMQSAAASVYANNNLRNAEVIQAMGMLPRIYDRWLQRQYKFLALQALASDRSAVINSVTKVARMAFQSLILGLAAWFAIDGFIAPGALIGAMVLMGRTLAPVEMLIGAWKQWISARESYHRLHELFETYPSLEKGMSLPAPTGEVTVENITVVPPKGELPVLKGLSFKINAGDVVGILGPSAAGKSSLARALLGIWRPRDGSVRLSGADIASWNTEDLGQYLGYLPQDIELFEGTVAENIARFAEVDSENVIAAAMAADVHDMILRLPKGYDTAIGVDGASLSGGQRQRLALARALYGDPALIVLDEPNSNLDEAGEAALIGTILQLKAKLRTVVVITHKLNVLSAVDKLLVLRDGALFAYGPRDKVLDHLKAPD
ncbi:MAG: type I secretion system permease/ATPase [Pseudomonadota bacterium]